MHHVYVVCHTSFPYEVELHPAAVAAPTINTFMTGQIAVARDPRKSLMLYYIHSTPMRNMSQQKYVHSTKNSANTTTLARTIQYII